MDPAVQDAEPPVPKTLIFPSADAIHRPSPPPAETVEALRPMPPIPPVPPARPSERPTRPTLPAPEDPSDASPQALSSSDILGANDEDDDEIIASGVKASTNRPPPPSDRRMPPWVVPAARIFAAALLLGVANSLLLDARPSITLARAARVASTERTPLAAPAVAPTPVPAARACVALAPPRFVAPRALINPGLDVSATATGFIVALAAANDEAAAVRLEGSSLRLAESIRVRPHTLAPIRRVTARDDARDGASDADYVDVRTDTDDARAVLAEGEIGSFRIGLAGGYVVARVHDRTHSLWPLPLPPKDRRIDALRVAARDDGGAVVVMKRGSTLYLGFVNGNLSAAGPLLTITRANASIGTPFVVANGAGAALAWAERANGAREWNVVVASLGGGEMETKSIAARISPSLAVLPDGGFVLAYADGPAASHRVVVRRLGVDLAPAGDLVVASAEGVNAGQPVIAVRPDGRALVAWLAVARGQPASVYATPLQCHVDTAL